MQTYEAKDPKAAECLAKDQDAMLTFYDFPAVHWIHLRTTNPIESTFATVRLRTVKSRGCGARASILSTVFKLAQSAEQRWQKLRGAEMIAKASPKFSSETESKCRRRTVRKSSPDQIAVHNI